MREDRNCSLKSGIWFMKEDGRTTNTPMVWETMYTNTTKFMTAFSDFPHSPKETPYLTSYAMNKYLHRYATHFGLLPHIKFNTRVLKVCKAADHRTSGKWEVFTCPTAMFRDGDMSAGLTAMPQELRKCQRDVFDFVVVCSGFFKKPKYPTVPGLDTFQGTIQHSMTYRTGKQYEDKTVLVVGNSLSAGDIANDISNHAHVVYLSVGQGGWIWPRVCSQGKPLDHCISRSMIYSANREVIFNDFGIREMQNKLDHFSSGLCPKTLPTRSPMIIGDDIYLRILSNRIQVYGQLKALEGSEATFDDGSRVTDLDAVVFCTGYSADLSFLDLDVLQDNGKMDLFKMMIPVKEGPSSTIAFIGITAPAESSGVALAEMQSRYIAKVFAGKVRPPSAKKMQEDADSWSQASFRRRGNYSYFLPVFLLNDSIAQLLGIYPSFWRLFFWDPLLALRSWYGPLFPAQFRLLGPDSNWEVARERCYKAHSEGSRPLQHKPRNIVIREDITAARWKLLVKVALAVPAMAAAAFLVHARIGAQS